jgi:hypothetical protein
MEQKVRAIYEKQLALDHADVDQPKLVKSLRNFQIMHVSAGFAHTGACTVDGALYMWGAGSGGQLGLGDLDDQGYVPYPIQVFLPHRVVGISCGNLHSALVTSTGKLFVCGNGCGGRLGLGNSFLSKNVNEFTHVKSLDRHDIAQVACGTTHTVCATRVIGYKRTNMSYRDRMLSVKGGGVFICGAAHAFAGVLHSRFSELHNLRKHSIVSISAGNAHTAVVTAAGELYTWGTNKNGGAAQPKDQHIIRFPQLVKCLYRAPINLAEGCPATQLDPWADRGNAMNAVNGHRSGLGNYPLHDETSMTQPRYQAYWEVDLRENYFIEEITVWNRNDVPTDKYKPRDFYMKRLFPCWVIVSEAPFPKGPGSLQAAIAISEEACRFDSGGRFFTWQLPINTVGRYVRVQLEKMNSLHLAEVEVFGRPDYCSSPVFSVECGKDVTAVVCRPRSAQDCEKAYLRAVAADRHNAVLLRQLPRFQDYFDVYQRGRAVGENGERCELCTHARLCDLCETRRRYNVLADAQRDTAFNNRLRSLDELGTLLIQEAPPQRLAQPPTQRRVRHCLSCITDVSSAIRQKTVDFVEGKKSEDDFELRKRLRGV